MPTYEYRCDVCPEDVEYLLVASDPPEEAPRCPVTHPRGGEFERLKRVFSFSTPPPSNQFGYEGYDPSTGSYVTSKADHRRKLRQKSIEATERHGYEHDFQQIHPADMREAAGITEDEEGTEYHTSSAHHEPDQRKTVYL